MSPISGRSILWARLGAVLVSLFLLVACGGQDTAPEITPAEAAKEVEEARLVARAERVQIIRDDYGVPHIYAVTDADAVFGMLYAQAEDDFKRVERNYIWAMGRLAEIDGEAALYSDLRARLFMTIEEAKAAYEAAPDWLKALCDAYADGLNYYLAANPEVTPQLLTRFEPWMPMFFSEGSIGGDIEQIPLGGITAFYADGTPRNAPRTLLDTSEPGGSNGIAIAGEHTASGDAMLLINPHTSFYFRGEMHVVSEEGLNAYGAVTWGQFFIYQGFNENTGWMHTSTYADFLDQFAEDVFEQDGTLYYTYGNEKRPVTVSTVTLKYKSADGVAERTFPTYHTHHGPITHMDGGKWVATKINWDPVNALQQSFVRTKLANHDEFRDMMNIRTNSSNNTVYADSSGNIAYYHGNFMPRRDARFDYSSPVNGADPATDWQGLHEVDEMITLLNPQTGWIQNANSTPFSAAAEHSPKREDFPPYMAPDAENFRAIHAIDLLREVEDGQTPKLTLEGLIELAYDDRLPAFETLIPGLLRAHAGRADTALTGPLETLRAWDHRVDAGSIAMTLAHFYTLNLLEAARARPELEPISRMDRLTRLATPDYDDLARAAFTQTINDLQTDFGAWQTPWGEVNRFQRLSGDIDLDFDDDQPSLPVGLASGRWGALAAFGARADENTRRIYGYRGNSFVAVVEFGDRVKAKSLLAGGQSGDPASPHFDDQIDRYVDHIFKDVAYYREDVEARARRSYRPGE